MDEDLELERCYKSPMESFDREPFQLPHACVCKPRVPVSVLSDQAAGSREAMAASASGPGMKRKYYAGDGLPM